MKVWLGFLGIWAGVCVQAESIIPQKQIDDIVRYQEQKRIFEAQHEELKHAASVYTEVQPLAIDHEDNVSDSCVHLKEINVDAITLIDSKSLRGILSPHLRKCNTIQDINAMVKRINNLYIKKGYVTSMAYIKPQEMSRGSLSVSAMEGRIESIKTDGVSLGFVFPFAEGRHLNLRDLETGIEQLNRLKSIQTTMQINPGTKEGYSQILMKGKKIASRLHGSLGVNNYGTSKSGKYQLSGSVGLDNPLGINDVLNTNLNTTSKQDRENTSVGNSISYAFPIDKSYLELSYSTFRYRQIVNGLNRDYSSNGKSKNVEVKLEYKLFHTKTQKGKFDLSLLRKKNDNYLAGVYLDTSSNKLTVMQAAYIHYYFGTNWDGYATFRYHRGLKWFGVRSGSFAKPVFHKYTLDLSCNKSFEVNNNPLRYAFSFHGQYAKEGIIGSEQIGIGGPYSVRGFKNEGQISGNKGFYLRNELSFSYLFDKGAVSPYCAMDYGVVSKNPHSYGGHILGIAVGARIRWYDFSLDLFKSMPVIDSNRITVKSNGDKVRKTNKGFAGFSLSYRF